MAFVPGSSGDEKGSEDIDGMHQPVGSTCVDESEVTLAAYTACVTANVCTAAGQADFCNWGRPDRLDHPINCVDWCQATAYCVYAGKRLPTAAEWVQAGRGQKPRIYPWGYRLPDNEALCWRRYDFDRREGLGTCPVTEPLLDKTPEGIGGMAGNVREWTSSRWNSITESRWKSVRGGAWETDPRYGSIRPDVNLRFDAATRVADLGFRCVIDAPSKVILVAPTASPGEAQ
jgi:formylglycine-generating enzyme required for sulfatase activity